MQCYTELTPPTAVTHSLALPFLSASANNLVVAKTSLLQVFSLKSVVTTITDDQSRNDQLPNQSQRDEAKGPHSSLPHSATAKGDRLQTTKLVLVAQFELAGTITSLARVKISRTKSGGEALLVALRDAKLSLVEWDSERSSISTISIHYYEREDILSNLWDPDLGSCVNYLSVDPSSRCAALKFGVRHLAIIPFHQVEDDLVMDDYDSELDGERPNRKQSVSKPAADGPNEKTPYAASFVLSLLALDPSLSHPIHLCFLHEYRDPTFGILYSQGATSSALLHERRDNVSYAVYTLDLEQRASTTLSSVSNLPYDLFAVVPLSRHVGGALLVGGNQIIHVDQSGKTNGVAVNDFAKRSTALAMLDQSYLNMRLENCVVKQLGLDNSDLLIILNTGELAILSFKIDGRSVSGLSIRRVKATNGGNAIIGGPSCASIVGRNRMFVGSEDSDSSVLGWSRKSDRLKRKPSRTQIDIDGDENEVDLEEEMDEDEDDLYAETKPETKRQEQTPLLSDADAEEDYTFRLHDSMVNYGPMTDVAIRLSSAADTNPFSNAQSNTELLVASGRGRAGGLTMFQRGVTTTQLGQPKIQNVHGVWSICTKRSQEDGRGDGYDKYVVASITNDTGDEKSAVYSINSDDGDFAELLKTDFDDADAGATIEVGTLNGGTKMIQVLQSELRSYDQGEFVLIFCFLDFSIAAEQWGNNWWSGSHATALDGAQCMYGEYYIRAMATRPRQTKCVVAKVVLHMSIMFDSINTKHISATISLLYSLCLQCYTYLCPRAFELTNKADNLRPWSCSDLPING